LSEAIDIVAIPALFLKDSSLLSRTAKKRQLLVPEQDICTRRGIASTAASIGKIGGKPSLEKKEEYPVI
jgi:hypothetical protein